MAIAFDNVSPDTESSAGVTQLTTGAWTISGSNRVVIGVIATGDATGASPTSMDHPTAGGALAQIGSTLNVGSHARLSLWRRVAPTTGSNTSHGDWASSQGEACIGLVSYTGVDQATPVGTPVTNTGNVVGVASFTASVNITTVIGDVVFAAAFFHEVASSNNGTVAPGSGMTGRYDIEGTQIGGWGALQVVEFVATGTTTSMTADFTQGSAAMSGDWGIIAVVVKAAGGGEPTVSLMGQACL